MSLLEMKAVEATRTKKFNIVGNVIKDVHLVGLQAQNVVKPNTTPYTYKEAALKEGTPLYANVDIYVGHGDGNEDRDPTHKIGYVENPVFKEGAGVFGDIVMNPKHTAYESFMWWAANKPEKLGMSHVARTFYDAKENAMTKIAKVYSVDFVSNGSTTHEGLFKEGLIVDKVDDEKWLSIVMSTFHDLCYEVMYPLGKTLTQEDKAVNLIPVIKDLLAEVSKIAADEVTELEDSEESRKSKESTPVVDNNTTKESLKEITMEFKDITLDELAKQRKDLVDAISTKAVESYVQTEEAVAEAIEAVPTDAQSDIFKRLVREAVTRGDKKAVDELVADRKQFASKTQPEVVVESATAPRKKIVKESAPALTLDSVASLLSKKN